MVKRLAFLSGCLALAAVPALAQTTGRISGTVIDTSGGALPGANVTVTEQRTGAARTVQTDRSGYFQVVSLPVGAYTVAVEVTGFKKVVRTGYDLVADGRLTADFALEVGAMEEVVEVTVAGEMVNTTSGEIARVVDREQVQNMALNGRNYMQLASLIPGAPLLNDNALNIMTDLGINTSVNGSRNNASLLTVDGGFNMDSGSNNSQISNVGIDFIEEVSIKTSNFSAEYGRNSGANINVVTRSGGNQFHGSAYEYHRNESLDANDYFSEARNVAKAPLDYNNFGWSLGGPIRKNNLYVFAGQEWKRIQRFTNLALRTVPTSAMRNGDFSALTTPIIDPLTGQPFPGNVIPTSRITPDGRAIANLYDAMADSATSYQDSGSNNLGTQGDNPFNFRQDLIRLDYQPSNNHHLTLRAIFDDYNLVAPYGTFIDSQLPTSPTNRVRPGRNLQASHTWSVRSNVINEFRANTSWNSQRIPPTGDVWQRETYGFTFPQLFAGGGRFENSIPDTTITGFASFNGVARSLISPTTDIQVGDNVTWVNGAHTLKGGALVVRNRKDQNGRSLYAGQLAFDTAGNTRTTGNAFADALLGNFRRYSEAQSDPTGFFRFWQIESFVSDNWRVSKDLSVEAGVRYTWHQPIYTQSNNMANFDPAYYDPARAVTMNRNGTLVPGSGDPFNGLVRAGEGVPDDELFRVPNGNSPAVLSVPAGAPRGFYPNRNLFAPRFSFAWTPTGSADLAIRGGAGLYYDRPEGNLLFGGGGNGPLNSPPYTASSLYENGNLAAPGGGTVPAPAAIGNIAAIHPDLQVPRSWSWSVSVQRELAGGVFGELGYVGSKGQNLIRQIDINLPSFEVLSANAALPAAQRANTNFLRPFKGYSAIFQRVSDGSSNYHALQLFLSKRRGSLRSTVSYTYSRARDNASGNDNGTGGNDILDFGLDLDGNWGPSTFDRPHVAVVTWTWQIPLFKEQTGVGRVLGGWEISGIGRYQSGAPLTVVANTSIGIRRADLVGEAYVPEDQQVDPNTAGLVRWLNIGGFAAAPEGRPGNSERSQFRGPSLTVVDLSLRKGFAVGRGVNLQVQADLFNAFNVDSLRFANQTLVHTPTGSFGQLDQAAPPRQIQLGARVSF